MGSRVHNVLIRFVKQFRSKDQLINLSKEKNGSFQSEKYTKDESDSKESPHINQTHSIPLESIINKENVEIKRKEVQSPSPSTYNTENHESKKIIQHRSPLSTYNGNKEEEGNILQASSEKYNVKRSINNNNNNNGDKEDVKRSTHNNNNNENVIECEISHETSKKKVRISDITEINGVPQLRVHNKSMLHSDLDSEQNKNEEEEEEEGWDTFSEAEVDKLSISSFDDIMKNIKDMESINNEFDQYSQLREIIRLEKKQKSI